MSSAKTTGLLKSRNARHQPWAVFLVRRLDAKQALWGVCDRGREQEEVGKCGTEDCVDKIDVDEMTGTEGGGGMRSCLCRINERI